MKRRLSALLCALTLALSLSGCWSGDVSDDSSGDFWEETPPVEADTSSTLTPITSFALPYLQGVTLDPITCPDGMQQTLGALLYEGLFVLDESFAPQNVLCSRYEHNDDCTSYTFYLRDGVSFSDGSSLTASDVLATLRRAQESERYSARFANVASMRASNGALIVNLTRADSACAVRAREIDNERAVACAHRGDVGKARAVALALLRAAKRREHIACRQAAAVGKADAVAEVKGVARAVVVVLIAAAQHILRRKRLVQHEKPLVEQRAKRLLHAVGAGDGVERHALQIRQCERRDRRQGGGGVRFHRRRFLPEVAAAVVAHIAAPAARKRKRERQRAQKRREAALHSASSVRQIIAAMPPRRSLIARCDQ